MSTMMDFNKWETLLIMPQLSFHNEFVINLYFIADLVILLEMPFWRQMNCNKNVISILLVLSIVKKQNKIKNSIH